MPEKVATLHSSGPEETKAHGRELAARLRRGDCVALVGDLGSGKTCLVQGICDRLKVADPVTSPTFILINEYVGQDASGAPLPVYHFDLYRLDGPDALFELGVDDYLYGCGICLIEWADRAGDLLPESTLYVQIDATGARSRRLTLTYPE